VKRIAVAGGIGAGKSTVVEFLRDRGFTCVDADDVYADLVQPGSPLLAALVDAFGSAVLSATGHLDRAFVARVVFADRSALRRLNAITHPAVGLEMHRRLDQATSAAAFAAIPLFRESHREQLHLDEVWSVLVEPDVALDRLVSLRHMDEDDARQRLAAQMSNDERLALSDVVIWNNAGRDELATRLVELLGERGLDGH